MNFFNRVAILKSKQICGEMRALYPKIKNKFMDFKA